MCRIDADIWSGQEVVAWYPLHRISPEAPATHGQLKIGTHLVVHKPNKLGLEDFDILKVVGKGHFGKVMMVKKKDTGAFYALKSVKKEDLVKRGGLP